ncbi:MAG: DNA polymerase [Patescibacteria group bacterium]
MSKVFLDFESRSECDIYATGAWVYAAHSSTEILCLCYAIDDGPVQAMTRANAREHIEVINTLVREGAEFHAHNAFFERCMWLHKLIGYYGARPIAIKQWRCTMAKASAHGLPRKLELAAKALDCKHQKDMIGNRLMVTLAKSKGPIDPDKLARLVEYCKQDVEVEREIDRKLPDLDPQEQQVWFMDQYINDTGVYVDINAVQKAAEAVRLETERLNAEINARTEGAVNKGTERLAVKNWLEEKGCVLPDLTKQTVAKALEENKERADLSRVLSLRQQLSLTSNAKYDALLSATSPDGRVRDLLVYHGAHTGRWSGKLVQIQNLVKPKDPDFSNIEPIHVLKNGGYDAFSLVYGDETLNTLSACIRGMFIPSPGCDGFITDFAAIEARVVLWFADEKEGVQSFVDQDQDPSLPDIYVKQARKIRRNPNLTKKDKKDRQLGKQTILASGYGMGEIKFQETCEKYSIDLGPKTLAVQNRDGETVYISPLARTAVQSYRETFPKVVSLWYAMEEAAKRAVLTGKTYQVSKVLWYMDPKYPTFLRMKLPSGRTIAYQHPRVKENRLSVMGLVNNKPMPVSMWGGALVENAVQGAARDIMVEAMFGAVRTGFRVLFTVHDELFMEAPRGTKNNDDVLRIVRTPPTWAAGCPINAECDTVERYRK